VIYNKRFNADILNSQKRLNLFGGEIPNKELLPVLQEYIASLADYYNPPEWVLEIEAKYGVSANRWKLGGGRA